MSTKFETAPIELAYKGTRTYLHGTDMYNSIVEFFSALRPQHLGGPLKMVMHEFARNQVDLRFSVGVERCPKPEKACLEFSLAEDISGWLSESDRPVITSRPYPEEEIVAGSYINGQTIVAGACLPFTAIEVLVSLTKRLHSTLRPGAAGWAFTRLELLRPLRDGDKGSLQVELVHALGNRLTKSVVRVGDLPLGHIYFSAVGS